MSTYDVIVIGGGSGGYAAALRASQLGKTVAIVERGALGGTCLHQGCIPTKAMLHAAEVADTVRGAAAYGITATFEGVDPQRVAAFRDGIVAKKLTGLRSLISARGIDVIEATATLGPERQVLLGDGTALTAPDVVLATGAHSRDLPGIPVGGRVVTSEHLLASDRLPASVVIVGGGVIGVEFASMLHSFGTAVTVLEAGSTLLPSEDEIVVQALGRAFRRRGIAVHTSVTVNDVVQDDSSVTARLEDGTEHSAELLLLAVGRAPTTADLGLAAAGVTEDHGFVAVDEKLRTSAPGIWAVGDIVRGPQLAHRAYQQGIAVAERIAGLHPVPAPDALVPRVVYANPELASIGLSLAQAIKQHGEAAIRHTDYNLAGNARSDITGTAGVVRVIRLDDGPVVGIHMAGNGVSELIGEAQLVVSWDAHPEDVAPLIHAHPTRSEALGEAFRTLSGVPFHTLG